MNKTFHINLCFSDQKITFTMPGQDTTGTLDIIVRLGNGVEGRYSFEYQDDPYVTNVTENATIAR